MNTTDFKVTRPIVLTSLACVICLYIILCGAFGALLSIILCCASVIIIGAVLLISDGLKPLFVFFACVIICCLNATFSYITHEKAAISFIDKRKENRDCLYEVQITSCRNYSAYAVADGVILSCDGKAINRSYKCRFSCYSGEGLEEGNIVYFKGVPQFPSNDEDEVFDNVSYLRSRKCFIVFSNVSIISSKLGPLSLRNKIHKSIERIIYLNVPQGNSFECGDLCYSVLLGNKQFLDSDLKDSFTKSGIIHLICVSGMHLSVIMGAVFAFLKFLGTKNHISAVILSVFCLLYLSIIGFPISAVRAGIICLIGYGGMLLGRSTEGFTSLFASVLIICIFSPYSVIDISAQLSFLSSLGIITACSLFSKDNSKKPVIYRIYNTVKFLIITNCSAVIFTYPIAAHSFGGISLTSVPATLLTGFLCELLLIFLLILIVLSPISFLQPITFWVSFICKICSKGLIAVAEFFSKLRYSYTQSENVLPVLIIFLTLLLLLAFFIYFDSKKFMLITYFLNVLLCIIFISTTLFFAIEDDFSYKISYFRQNKDDRQISIKLARQGYLIINADNNICTNIKKADFDQNNGENYFLIIPDENINPKLLYNNLKIFNKHYGIKSVFVPNTPDGIELKNALISQGCNTLILENILDFGSFEIEFDFTNNDVFFTVDDGKIRTGVLFSNEYSKEKFKSPCHIAAFFTRETKNQFDIDNDILPECDKFITRLTKDDVHEKIHNTYGEKSFYIKE